uniref:Uncharacterized protein n=1 Tax=Anguilla anguilla TaxID=7936 RepID=A0A0E9UVN4_ANGAN
MYSITTIKCENCVILRRCVVLKLTVRWVNHHHCVGIFSANSRALTCSLP